MNLQLAPLHADPRALGLENGVRIWEASSNDPSFLATVPEGSGALAAGWYCATATLDGRSGDIHRPQVYIPDQAGHFSEDRSVQLMREGPGYTADFFLPHAVDHLRFDPSVSPCEFACDSLQVANIQGPRRRKGARANSHIAAFVGWGRARLQALVGRARSHAGAVRTNNRKARVLETIDRNGLGVEIGPSHDPIAPKREGFKVQVIDHASREELLGKYGSHGVSLDKIEEVDFVWSGQSYVELTGKPKHYDWIIASHLIEHTPDLIAFLEDCDSILRDGGVLSLVIPDKRYCFDRFRPITGLARIVDSHLSGNKIHSPGAVAEYCMNVVGKAHHLAWDARSGGEYTFIHSANLATEMVREVREKGSYLDIHNWCFVPHSFRLLLNDLYVLGYTKLREVQFHPTEGFEFYVTLGRHGSGPPMSRLEMLKAIDAEISATDAGG